MCTDIADDSPTNASESVDTDIDRHGDEFEGFVWSLING
jgi:hypothetical protein